MSDGAHGAVIVRYRGRIARLKGGAIGRDGEWIVHSFSSPGNYTLKRRWWCRRPVEVGYVAIGGGGGAGGSHAGQDGEVKQGETTVVNPLSVSVGIGGRAGRAFGQGGGASGVSQ